MTTPRRPQNQQQFMLCTLSDCSGTSLPGKKLFQDYDPSLFLKPAPRLDVGQTSLAVARVSSAPAFCLGNCGCTHGISAADSPDGKPRRSNVDLARSHGRQRTSRHRARKTPVEEGVVEQRPCPNQEGLDKGRRAMPGCLRVSRRPSSEAFTNQNPRSLVAIGGFSSLSSRNPTPIHARSLVCEPVD